MKFGVFHKSKPDFMEPRPIPETLDSSLFDLVAFVEANNHEEVFEKTNHIVGPWWENDGVILVEQSRSTSVGDVIMDGTGTAWLCCGAGWERIQNFTNLGGDR